MRRLLIPFLVVLAVACVVGGTFLGIEVDTTKGFGFAGAVIVTGPMLVLIALAIGQGPERGRAGGGSSDHR